MGGKTANIEMMRLVIIIFLCTLTATTGLHCGVNRSSGGRRSVDCRLKSISSIPTDIPDSSSVSSLDLSGNSIARLGADAFALFPGLVHLNLSTSGILAVHESSFRGLLRLTVLDLTNNPFLNEQQQRLPDALLDFCPSLVELFISGSPIRGTIFSRMQNLEQITMTPHISYMPYELADLSKLRILNFAFGVFGNKITRKAMQPFSASNLEEIAFHTCGIVSIEEGTFDNFTNLRLLNFAGNIYASVPQIIGVLSKARNLQLESLVLDLVGSYHFELVILGKYINGSCARIWNKLKHLSIRGIRWHGIDHLECMDNLVSLSLGFNSPLQLIFDFIPSWTMLENFTKIRYVDASYLLVNDNEFLNKLIGYDKGASWIPPNHSYFPRAIPDWQDNDCGGNVTYTMVRPSGTECRTYHAPRCLTYIKLDHFAYKGSEFTAICTIYTRNNLRYLNMSHKIHDQDWDAEFVTGYGLDRLEILDVCSVGLAHYDESKWAVMPNLRELYLCKNNMGSGQITQFPNLRYLTLLDLSSNEISTLGENTFSLLSNLTVLNLMDNKLYSASWLTSGLRSLHNLYLQDNDFIYLNTSQWDALVSAPREKNVQVTVNLQNNPLICDCEHLDFLAWFTTTTIVFEYEDELTCIHRGSDRYIAQINENKFRGSCNNNVHKLRLGGSIIATVIILCMLTVVMYKHRWSIKWTYYKTRYRIQLKTRAEPTTEGRDNKQIFSAFVVYPHDDSSTRSWVVHSLRSKIEEQWLKKECFIRGRDDLPGMYDIDNIVQGLSQCSTALWVICPTFFEDRWCEMAANFAFHSLGAKNNALLIMENRFEEYKVPKQFASLLHRKHQTLRLRYTNDVDGRNLFWSKLEAFIPK